MIEKETNVIQNLFVDIKKIIDSMIIKDLKEANKYENDDIKAEAKMWIDAQIQIDNYMSYKSYWEVYMFQKILPSIGISSIKYWKENPLNVPMEYRDTLLEEGRKLFLESYVEKNDYYRMLCGLPPIDTKVEDFIFLNKKTYQDLNIDQIAPIHELSIIN